MIWPPDAMDVTASRYDTCGNWVTEKQAEDDLVSMIDATDAFYIYRQVAGEPLWKHHFQSPQQVRCDVLLLPAPKLLDLGWHGGAIVIETKKSGVRFGPGLSQLVDYTNSAFYLSGGVAVVPTFGFLFPVQKQHGPLASVMAQQHIGAAEVSYGRLVLSCGESNVLTISRAGEVKVGTVNFGRRLGAR